MQHAASECRNPQVTQREEWSISIKVTVRNPLPARGVVGRAPLTLVTGRFMLYLSSSFGSVVLILYRSRTKHGHVGRIIAMTSRETIDHPLRGCIYMRRFIAHWPGVSFCCEHVAK
jgi:hypothetical protein